MKIIFMGTPDFSVGTLEALVEAGHEVVLAVTQPDKPKGRGKEMQFTPVKECALAHNIPVYQPKKIREPECIEELKKYQAEKAKKEKLQSTQNHVKGMSEDALKDKVSAFLNAHPEFCDDFNG